MFDMLAQVEKARDDLEALVDIIHLRDRELADADVAAERTRRIAFHMQARYAKNSILRELFAEWRSVWVGLLEGIMALMLAWKASACRTTGRTHAPYSRMMCLRN